MKYNTWYSTPTIDSFEQKFAITKIFILFLYSWLVLAGTIHLLQDILCIDWCTDNNVNYSLCQYFEQMHIITKMQTWSFIFIPHIYDCLLISQSIISIKAVVDHSRCRCIRCCNVRYRYNSNDNIVVYCFLSNFVFLFESVINLVCLK